MSGDWLNIVALLSLLLAFSAWLSHTTRFSIIPFLMLLGMVFGPHGVVLGPVDLRIMETHPLIDLMSRFGILLLMFYLGLEFSLRSLVRSGKRLLQGGSIYIGLNLLRGVLLGVLLFGTVHETLIIIGITTFSSSAIVAKLLVDNQRLVRPETDLILGVMMLEDVVVAIYLTIISGILLSGSTQLSIVLFTLGKTLFIIGLFLFIGWKSRLWIEHWLKEKSDEFTILFVIALLLSVAFLANLVGMAEAIGALMLGLILAEISEKQKIKEWITPMRDLFGAIFFFSFGLTIDFRTFDQALLPAVIAVLFTVVGNILAGIIAGRAVHYSWRQASYIGFSIMARGEFAIIVTSLALTAHLNPMLQPFAALYVLLLVMISPWLIKYSKPLYNRMIQPVVNHTPFQPDTH